MMIFGEFHHPFLSQVKGADMCVTCEYFAFYFVGMCSDPFLSAEATIILSISRSICLSGRYVHMSWHLVHIDAGEFFSVDIEVHIEDGRVCLPR